MTTKFVEQVGRIRARVVWPIVLGILAITYFGQSFAAAKLGQGDLGLMERATWPAVRDLCIVIFWPILFMAAVFMLIHFLTWAFQNFPSLFDVEIEKPPPKEEKKPDIDNLPPVIRSQVVDVQSAMQDMQSQIAKVHRRRHDAQGQLVELETVAELMAKMVVSTAQRADHLEKVKTRVKNILKALGDNIVPGDEGAISPIAIAEIAGELGDPSLATLVCSPHRNRYNGPLAETLGRYAGALQNQVETLDNLNHTWLVQLGECREQVLMLQETVQAADAIPIMLRIRGHLDTARLALGFDMQGVQKASVTQQIYLPNDPDVIDIEE